MRFWCKIMALVASEASVIWTNRTKLRWLLAKQKWSEDYGVVICRAKPGFQVEHAEAAL